MRTITIITDWKKADYYMAVLRGMLMSGDEEVRIAELSHQVESYKIEQAAFILKSSVSYFPSGTIHLIAVRAEPDSEARYFATEWNKQYFLFSDNGFATLFWQDGIPEDTYIISGFVETSFPEADIFANAALKIISDNGLSSFEKYTGTHLQKTPPMPWHEDNVITGTVIHCDSYGNAITNVSKDYFLKYAKDRKFVINPGNSFYPIRSLNDHYRDVSPSDQLAIFNKAGLLEIAIRNGSARDLLGLKEGTNIRIEIL